MTLGMVDKAAEQPLLVWDKEHMPARQCFLQCRDLFLILT